MAREGRISNAAIIGIVIAIIVIGILIYSWGASNRDSTPPVAPNYIERSPGAGAGQTQPSPRP